MSNENKTSDSTIGVESTSSNVSKFTIKYITYHGINYTPEWTTEGLKVPMVINNRGSNHPFIIIIPREEIVKMFKDINEELSHT